MAVVVGLGIDLVAVERLQRLLERREEPFLTRVFTARERADCAQGRQRARRFAARFAAKEAALKALGTGLAAGLRWREIEVVRGPRGRPELVLHGRAAQLASERGIDRLSVSLSHDGPFAAAVVIAESQKGVPGR